MKIQITAGESRMALVLVLVLVSGWYLSKLLGALTSLLMFLLTVFAASHFVYTVHDMPNRRDAFYVMLTYLFGLHYPIVEVAEGRLTEKSRGTPGAKLGGPGIVKVAEDSAAVLVRGKEVKVVGPGTYVAKRGEAVKDAVDLRPQTRSGTVKAMTKDGFEIEIMFFVGFQIDPGGREPAREEPYPFSKRAVLQAVYQSKQVDTTGAQTWHERVPGAVFGNVREMIATHYLEDFFEPDHRGSNPRRDFKQWLVGESRGAAEHVGARLNWVNFTTPKIPEEAAKQFIKRLQARTEKSVAEADADNKKLKVNVLAYIVETMGTAMQAQGLPASITGEVIKDAVRYIDPELERAFRTFSIPFGSVTGEQLLRGGPPSGSQS